TIHIEAAEIGRGQTTPERLLSALRAVAVRASSLPLGGTCDFRTTAGFVSPRGRDWWSRDARANRAVGGSGPDPSECSARLPELRGGQGGRSRSCRGAGSGSLTDNQAGRWNPVKPTR